MPNIGQAITDANVPQEVRDALHLVTRYAIKQFGEPQEERAYRGNPRINATFLHIADDGRTEISLCVKNYGL